MLKQIADKECLLAHARLLEKKNFKPGFDGMTADAAVMWITINGAVLAKDIERGRYSPMPASGFRTAKLGGGYRQLGKLTALDTVVQYAIINAISDHAERRFSDLSFAYRPGRGVAQAIEKYCAFSSEHAYAAKLDPIACYDNISHVVLEKALNDFFDDTGLVELIMKFVKIPIIIDGVLQNGDDSKGILQGAPLSSLLCNIYFNQLDEYLDEKGFCFIRYADDIVLFSDTVSGINAAFAAAEKYMNKELLLETNSAKSVISSSAKLKYLGYRFEHERGRIIALEADNSSVAAYRRWHESSPENDRRCIDILSDGILRQKEYSLAFETALEESDIPICTTGVINIYSNVIFDSGSLKRALDNGIYINIFDKTDCLVGQFTPNVPLKSPHVTIEQLSAYYDNSKRLALARSFVLASIHNLRLVIRYYNKQEPKKIYDLALTRISKTEKKIKDCESYEELLMLEAQIRGSYYDCFDSFITADGFEFVKRSRRPPRNEFNAMLSFGNTVLYNLIAVEVNRSPLDVRIGYLHATNNRMQSLNLDIAEIFKPLVVDRTVLALINRRAINPEHFRVSDGGVYLNEDGKRIFLRAFYDKLDTCVAVRDKDASISYNRIISEEVQKLVRHFRQGDKYAPFKQVR